MGRSCTEIETDHPNEKKIGNVDGNEIDVGVEVLAEVTETEMRGTDGEDLNESILVRTRKGSVIMESLGERGDHGIKNPNPNTIDRENAANIEKALVQTWTIRENGDTATETRMGTTILKRTDTLLVDIERTTIPMKEPFMN